MLTIRDLKKLLYVDVNNLEFKVNLFVVNSKVKNDGFIDYLNYEDFINDEKINDLYLVEDNPVELMKNKIVIWAEC